MSLFHTHIVVDWSARSRPSPATPGKDAIWWAAARASRRGVVVQEPEYARTRHDAVGRLARIVADELERGRRVLVGFDFPFGYPAGVAERVSGRACALALWDWLAARIEDAPDNANNRYAVAAAINQGAYPGRRAPSGDIPPHMALPGDSGEGVGAHARMRAAGAPHRRSSRKGCEDRLAVVL